MINLLLEKLKAITKIRKVKDYKNKSEDEFIKILTKPKPKINVFKQRIEQTKQKS